MKKFGTRLLAAVVTSSLIVTPVMASPSTDSMQKSINSMQKDKAASEKKVKELENQVLELAEKIGDLEEKLVEVGEKRIQAESDLEEAEEKEQEQYEAMKKRIQYMYEEGNSSVFETLLTSEDFSDLVSKAEYVQNVHTYDREQLNEYIETKEQIAELKTSLEEDEKKLEETQAEYEANGEKLNVLLTTAKEEVSDLDERIQQAIAEKEEKERQEAEAAAEAERQRQAAAASSSNNTSNNNSGSSGSSNSSSNSSSSSGSSNSSSTSGGSSGSSGNSSLSTGSVVVSRAYSQLGKPYLWGACGPNSFDCSGLVSYCLTGSCTRVGTAYSFMGWARVSNPQPGDICTTYTHCGIYIGNGQMIHAPHTGDVVKISPVQSGMVYVRP